MDSILNLFRTDYVGRGQLSERQQQLGLHLRRLADFAEEFNIAVFVTNHVQSDPGASALFSGADGRKPTGGHVMAHASTTRLLLRKGRGEERVAKLMDSPGKLSLGDCTRRNVANAYVQTVRKARLHTLSRRAGSTIQKRHKGGMLRQFAVDDE